MSKSSYFSVDKPEYSLGFLLWKNTTLWQRRIKAALAVHDLTHAQFVILAVSHWFRENDIEPTQVNISEKSGLDKMTVSKSLKKLIAVRLVNRSENIRDTRAKLVLLTSKGEKLISQLVKNIEEIDLLYFGALSTQDQKEIGRLFRVLESENSDKPTVIF